MNYICIYIEAKYLAIKRRIHIFIYGKFDPYPKVQEKFKLSPNMIIENYYREKQHNLIIDNYSNYSKWKIKSRKKLIELLKIKNDLYCKEISTQNIKINNELLRKKIYIEFAKNRQAPIDIITDRNRTSFKGIIICMQGTNSGAHLNIGKKLMPADVYKLNNKSDIAIQAAKFGFIAVSFERIGFGERREQNLKKANTSPTLDISMHFLMNGKTLLGETVNEILTLSKWLSKRFNNTNIWLKGYSAAGTAAITAAAVDEKNIKGIAVGGCVGPIFETLLKRGSTGYNDIPEIVNYFDFDTIISLISPRPCIIVAGKHDHIWPHKLAIKVINKAKKVFNEDNANDKLILLKGLKGHTYYPELLWPQILKYFK